MSFTRVARSVEVQAPRFLRREVQGRRILLTRLSDGTAVAFGNICPHQNRELDGGMLWEDEIDCPHHHYTYDPRTGENRFPKRVFPARRAATVPGIPIFETREESGWVWVELRGDTDAAADAPQNTRNHRIDSLRSELHDLQVRIAEAQDEQHGMIMELSELVEEKRRIAKRQRQQERAARRRGDNTPPEDQGMEPPP